MFQAPWEHVLYAGIGAYVGEGPHISAALYYISSCSMLINRSDQHHSHPHCNIATPQGTWTQAMAQLWHRWETQDSIHHGAWACCCKGRQHKTTPVIASHENLSQWTLPASSPSSHGEGGLCGRSCCEPTQRDMKGKWHCLLSNGIWNAGNKVVEYTDRTAAEVDELIKERQERNKVLREPQGD